MLFHNPFLVIRTAEESLEKKAKKWLFFAFENQRLHYLVKRFLQGSVQEKHLFKDLSNLIIYNNLWDSRSGYSFTKPAFLNQLHLSYVGAAVP